MGLTHCNGNILLQVPNPPPAVTAKQKLPTRHAAGTLTSSWQQRMTSPATTVAVRQNQQPSTAGAVDEPQLQESVPLSSCTVDEVEPSSKNSPRKVLLRKRIRSLQCQRWKMCRLLFDFYFMNNMAGGHEVN